MTEYNKDTSISGTGNTQTRLNEITSDKLGFIRNFICGYSLDFKKAGCIVKDEKHDFNCIVDSQDKNTVHLTDGLAFAYGYFGGSKAVDFMFLPPAVEQYFFIYLEINKSVIPNTCEVKIKNNYASAHIENNTFRQDELSVIKTGIYQIPLWIVKVTNKGIAELKDLRNLKEYIQKVIHSDLGLHVLDDGILGQNVTTPTASQNDIDKTVANTEFAITAISEEINK